MDSQTQHGPEKGASHTTKRRKTLFHNPVFRKIMSLPIWGGRYSYIIVETDPGQELDCIDAFQTTASPETRLAMLGPILQPFNDKQFPPDLKKALDGLQQIYPPTVDDKKILAKLIRKKIEASVKYSGTSDEFNKELEGHQQVFEWARILKAVPTEVSELLADWNRLERNQVYNEVNRLEYLSPVTLQYFNANVNAILTQENRWQHGVLMGFVEAAFFWLWMLIMQLGVFIPDTISVFLGAVLAVFRSGPIRLQGEIMAIAILDFPWRDERLARFITFQRFIGVLPSAVFGISAIFHPDFHRTAFSGARNLVWKAVICIAWQMFMLNWKSLYDMYFYKRIRRTRLTKAQDDEVCEKYDKLKQCNEYAYAWFATYKHSNRFGAQLSYHKQDHSDAAITLKWAAGIEEHVIPNDDLGSKVFIVLAIVAIGCLICASTFPVDPYAGLIALAYYGPLILRSTVDAWDTSQSFEDLLRLFTTTAGPTFPSTIVLIVNVVYWGVTKKDLFVGFRNARFGITFAVLFVFSLYPKLWGEGFKSGGLWIQRRLMKKKAASDQEDKGLDASESFSSFQESSHRTSLGINP
jgi:hypothetical protein